MRGRGEAAGRAAGARAGGGTQLKTLQPQSSAKELMLCEGFKKVNICNRLHHSPSRSVTTLNKERWISYLIDGAPQQTPHLNRVISRGYSSNPSHRKTPYGFPEKKSFSISPAEVPVLMYLGASELLIRHEWKSMITEYYSSCL